MRTAHCPSLALSPPSPLPNCQGPGSALASEDQEPGIGGSHRRQAIEDCHLRRKQASEKAKNTQPCRACCERLDAPLPRLGKEAMLLAPWQRLDLPIVCLLDGRPSSLLSAPSPSDTQTSTAHGGRTPIVCDWIKLRIVHSLGIRRQLREPITLAYSGQEQSVDLNRGALSGLSALLHRCPRHGPVQTRREDWRPAVSPVRLHVTSRGFSIRQWPAEWFNRNRVWVRACPFPGHPGTPGAVLAACDVAIRPGDLTRRIRSHPSGTKSCIL